MLLISIRDIYNLFPRNKVTVVLKFALLASHLAEILFENLRKNSETLHMALFNLCYVFHIVFIKHIKWCIVSHTIVQRIIPVHQIPMIISDM